jgi:hypothetical protein
MGYDLKDSWVLASSAIEPAGQSNKSKSLQVTLRFGLENYVVVGGDP